MGNKNGTSAAPSPSPPPTTSPTHKYKTTSNLLPSSLSSLQLPLYTLTGDDTGSFSADAARTGSFPLLRLDVDWLFPFTEEAQTLKDILLDTQNSHRAWEDTFVALYTTWTPDDENERYKGLPSALLLRIKETFTFSAKNENVDEDEDENDGNDDGASQMRLLEVLAIALRSEHNRKVLLQLGMLQVFSTRFQSFVGAEKGKDSGGIGLDPAGIVLACQCLRQLVSPRWRSMEAGEEEEMGQEEVDELWQALLPGLRELEGILWEEFSENPRPVVLEGMSALVDATGAVLKVSPPEGIEWFIGHSVELLTLQLEHCPLRKGSILSSKEDMVGRSAQTKDSGNQDTPRDLLHLWAGHCALCIELLTLANMPLARHRHEPALFKVVLAFDEEELIQSHASNEEAFGYHVFPMSCGALSSPLSFCTLMNALCKYVIHWQGPLGNAFAVAFYSHVKQAHWVVKLHAVDMLLKCVDLQLSEVGIDEELLFDLPMHLRHDVVTQLIPREALPEFVRYALRRNDDQTMLILHHASHPDGLPLAGLLTAAQSFLEPLSPACISVLLDALDSAHSVEEINEPNCTELLSLLFQSKAHQQRLLQLLERLFQQRHEEEVTTWLAEKMVDALKIGKEEDKEWVVLVIRSARLEVVKAMLEAAGWLDSCVSKGNVRDVVDILVALASRSLTFQKRFLQNGLYDEVYESVRLGVQADLKESEEIEGQGGRGCEDDWLQRVDNDEVGEEGIEAVNRGDEDGRDGLGYRRSEADSSADGISTLAKKVSSPSEPQSNKPIDIIEESMPTLKQSFQNTRSPNFSHLFWLSSCVGLTKEGFIMDAMLVDVFVRLLIDSIPFLHHSPNTLSQTLETLSDNLCLHHEETMLPAERARRLANATACAEVLDLHGRRPILMRLCELLNCELCNHDIAIIIQVVSSVAQSYGDVYALKQLLDLPSEFAENMLKSLIPASRPAEMPALILPKPCRLCADVALPQNTSRLVFTACVRVHDVRPAEIIGNTAVLPAFSFTFASTCIGLSLNTDGSVELSVVAADGQRNVERSEWRLSAMTQQDLRILFTSTSASLTLTLPGNEKPSLLKLALPTALAFSPKKDSADASGQEIRMGIEVSPFDGELIRARLGLTSGRGKNRFTLWSLDAESFHQLRGVWLSGEEGKVESDGRVFSIRSEGMLQPIQALGGPAVPLQTLSKSNKVRAIAWFQAVLLGLGLEEDVQKMAIRTLAGRMREIPRECIQQDVAEACQTLARALSKRKEAEPVFVAMCRHVLLDVEIWAHPPMSSQMIEALKHVHPPLLRQIMTPCETICRMIFHVQKEEERLHGDDNMDGDVDVEYSASCLHQTRRSWTQIQRDHEGISEVYASLSPLMRYLMSSLEEGGSLDAASIEALMTLILSRAGRDGDVAHQDLLDLLASQPPSALPLTGDMCMKNFLAVLACSRSARVVSGALRCWTKWSVSLEMSEEVVNMHESFWVLLRDVYREDSVDVDDLSSVLDTVVWCTLQGCISDEEAEKNEENDFNSAQQLHLICNAHPLRLALALISRLPCESSHRRQILGILRDTLRQHPRNCQAFSAVDGWQADLLSVLYDTCRHPQPTCGCLEAVICCMDAIHLHDILLRTTLALPTPAPAMEALGFNDLEASPALSLAPALSRAPALSAQEKSRPDGEYAVELQKTLEEVGEQALSAVVVNRVCVLVEQECVKWEEELRETVGLQCVNLLSIAMDSQFQIAELTTRRQLEQWFFAIEAFLSLLNTLDCSPLEMKTPHAPCGCAKCMERVKLVPVLTRMLLTTILLAVSAEPVSPAAKWKEAGRSPARKTGVHARALVYICSIREAAFLSEKEEFYVIACLVHALMAIYEKHSRFAKRVSSVISHWVLRQASTDLSDYLPPLQGRGSIPPTPWDSTTAKSLGLHSLVSITTADWQYAAASHLRLTLPLALSSVSSTSSAPTSCLDTFLSAAAELLKERRKALVEAAAEERELCDNLWKRLQHLPPGRWEMGASESVLTRMRVKLGRRSTELSKCKEPAEEVKEALLDIGCLIVTPVNTMKGRLVVDRESVRVDVVSGAAPAPEVDIESVEEGMSPMRLLSSALKTVLLQSKSASPRKLGSVKDPDRGEFTEHLRWPVDNVVRVEVRRYRRRWTAAEFFVGSTDRRTHFLDFGSPAACKKVLKTVGKLIKQSDAVLSPADRARRLQRLMRAWQQREISNLRYLMLLNTLAGRSYNDLSQYPVMPWVLKDFESDVLDLEDEESFRDLRLPVGAQCEEHRSALQAKYEETRLQAEAVESGNEDAGLGSETHRILHGPAWHFGSHYLSRGTVLWYLVRMEPFTTLHVKLQDGRFDHADRQFSSLYDAWHSIAQPTGLELTPEFFGCPEFLRLDPGVSLGQRQDGRIVGDVELPPWAAGSPERFVYMHRQALESEYVSRNLHHWIDLIFGYKQRGRPAVDAFNTYFHLMYDEAVDLSAVQAAGEELYNTVINISNEYGQIPPQLFQEPHPQRNPNPNPGPVLAAPIQPITLQFGSSASPVEGGRLFRSMISSAAGESVATVDNASAVGIHSLIDDTDGMIMHCNMLGKLSGWRTLMESSPLINMQSVVVCRDVIISCGYLDGSIRSRRISMRKPHMQRHVQHSEVVTCLAVGEKHKRLVSGSVDCTVVVWNVKRDMIRVYRRIYGHSSAVTCVALSTDLDMIVSADVDKRCYIHTIEQGEVLHVVDLKQQLPAALQDNYSAFPAWAGISPQRHYICVYVAEAKVAVSISANGRIVSNANLEDLQGTIVYAPGGEYIIHAADSSVVWRDVFSLRLKHDLTVELPEEVNNLEVLQRSRAGRFNVVVNTIDEKLYLLSYSS